MSDEINLSFREKVEDFVSTVFGGLHRVQKLVDNGNHFVCVPHGSLSTVDDNRLTKIVIASHRLGLRAEVDNHGMRGVKILLHNRLSRTGALWQRHPTIEQVLGIYADKASAIDGGEET